MTYVLLHGFTGDASVFDELTVGLAGRVLRPTLPGHGPGPDPVLPWGQTVDGLAGWLRAEGVRGAHLVGYSLGGRIGWGLLEHPGLFARATLIGAHPGLDDPAQRAARRDSDARWIERLQTEGVEGFVDAWEQLPLWATQVDLPAERRARQRAIRRSHTAAGLASALRHLGLAEMPRRPVPRVPVHLVVGELDVRHVELARSLPHPRTIVAGVGHNVVLEAPDALRELLR